MPTITFADRQIACDTSQSVLDALLDAGFAIPHGCRQGICQSCLLRADSGTVPESAQQGLSAVKQKQGYFLSCRCQPTGDLHISQKPPEDHFHSARVIEKRRLNAEVMLITLECQENIDYFAGQFVNLRRAEDGLVRSYSIANSRQAGHKLNFHIRKLPGGRFSEWVFDRLSVGDTLEVSEPKGESCYTPGQNLTQPLLLIGTGTGLAPLAGIVQEAITEGHIGEIHVYHGSRTPDSLYWVDEMQKLTDKHAHIHYTPCVSREACSESFSQGRAHDVALNRIESLKGWRVYLCGHPDMVKSAKQQAYLKGASLKEIHADPFLVGAQNPA